MTESRLPITNEDNHFFFKNEWNKENHDIAAGCFKMSDSYVLFTEKLCESTLTSALLFNY